jgi:hypothetical protein
MAKLTESSEAMGQQNHRKSLQSHPYRRHTWTPTHFPPMRPRFSRFRAELPHRTPGLPVDLATMGRDTACMNRPANGIDQVFLP